MIDPQRPAIMTCPTRDHLRGMGHEQPRPGSTPSNCQRCRAEVFIGPNQASVMASHPVSVVLCFTCAVEFADPTDAEVEVLNKPRLDTVSN